MLHCAHSDSLCSPPQASLSSSAALRCRPPFSARPTRASCISFAAAASARDTALSPSSAATPPSTARRPSSLSGRRLTTGTTTQWQFLGKTPAQHHQPPATRSNRLSPPPCRPRPATARVLRVARSQPSVSSSVSAATPCPPPTRPATCRGPRTSAQSNSPSIVLVDPRVLEEAARHETEHDVYAGPLAGRSVDVQPRLEHLVHSNRQSRVVHAVSLTHFHRTKAFQARMKGDQSRALVHLEKLLAMAPQDSVALFQLAVAYEKTRQLQAARTAYARVLEHDASNPFVHYNLGNLLMKLELVDDAIAAYTAAIQRSGSGKCEQWAFYRQRGAAFRKKGEFEKAAQDYARVHAVTQRRASVMASRSTNSTPAVDAQLVGKSVALQPQDVADASSVYSAEPLYHASRFASLCVSWKETATTQQQPVLDETMHRRAMQIAAQPLHARSDDDLWFLSDLLQRCFRECAALDAIACKELSARVVAGTTLPSGTLLMEEGTRGGAHIFFIARGRVNVYKQFASRVVSSQTTGADTTRRPIVSWETLRATMLDDDRSLQVEAAPEAAMQSTTTSTTVDVAAWSSDHYVLLTQLTAGQVCGRHGRFLPMDRAFSAVVSETCDVFAVSWADYLEVERVHRETVSQQTARFFTTVPLFHGIPLDELTRVAKRARSCKIVGQRVVCCEGQHVNGVLIVRQGHLCQLHPSELTRPPNLSVTFNLSGDVSATGKDSERGLHLFTQLEFGDDPLLFAHDSALTHGFLPSDYLPRMLAKLPSQQQLREDAEQREQHNHGSDAEPAAGLVVAPPVQGATSLPRGAFFSASSSWIPPRKSRREDLARTTSHGVACAKAALISTESCDLVFLSASDLTHGLSLASRTLLQTNMQHLLTGRRLPCQTSTPRAVLSKLSRLVFFKQPSGDDLVQRFKHNGDWTRYKHTLVRSLVATPRLAANSRP